MEKIENTPQGYEEAMRLLKKRYKEGCNTIRSLVTKCNKGKADARLIKKVSQASGIDADWEYSLTDCISCTAIVSALILSPYSREMNRPVIDVPMVKETWRRTIKRSFR